MLTFFCMFNRQLIFCVAQVRDGRLREHARERRAARAGHRGARVRQVERLLVLERRRQNGN
jgi:hypothetical protein